MVKKSDKKLDKYNPRELEEKWQEFWEEKKLFEAPQTPPKSPPSQGGEGNEEGGKLYILDMFPYPSAEGLHVGHPEGYTATDILSRYWRMKGKNVLHPMGWDAFGLPAENYALKTGVHPAITTTQNIERFRAQIKSIGLSYDWSREINTTDPQYYKWTQWIFLKLYEKGLAYEAEMPINWCPSCKTGLANEEVINGKCDRCGTEVQSKLLRQWMLKITAYADRLLEELDDLDWPNSIKKLQTDWIGKKMGANVIFPVRNSEVELEIFTTRLDTIFGVTYMAVAPEHSDLEKIVTPAQSEAVRLYVQNSSHMQNVERKIGAANQKTGVFTGAHAINPLTGEEIPVWVCDYVLADVGTGALMGVPAHDARDYEFAKAHDLPITPVVLPERKDIGDGSLPPEQRTMEVGLPYLEDGILVDSGSFTGLHSEQARKTLMDYLQRRGEGEPAVTYKLRDWVFSRQRYWGEPIPLVHCESCGVVPIPEEDLPLMLPEVEKYEPTGTGESPLANIEEWVNTKCPKCDEPARRETNTMPQWAGSCWYYLRFIDPKNDKAAWDAKKEQAWMPVDIYVGGAEHAVLHLLYARFWHKVLYDLGLVSSGEPFKSLRNQGMILGPDGQKMSKSRGNVINPDEIVDKYGADTLRMYEMFMGPFEDAKPWNTRSMIGINRFLNRVWDFYAELINNKKFSRKKNAELEDKLQALVNKVTSDIENFKFNTAIAAMMEFSHDLMDSEIIKKSVASTFIILISPFAPHFAEELWRALGKRKSIQLEDWPEVKELQKPAEINLAVQVNGKLRDTIIVASDADKEDVLKEALKSDKVKKYVSDPESAKIIYVPGRVLNFVTKK